MALHLLFGTWFFGYPDSDNIMNSPLLGGWGFRIKPLIDRFVGFRGEVMLATRVQNTPSFFFFVFMLLWAGFELIMR